MCGKDRFHPGMMPQSALQCRFLDNVKQFFFVQGK